MERQTTAPVAGKDVVVTKASLTDAQAIHDTINLFAQRGDMLPRTMGEVYENLRDFYVARGSANGDEKGEFLGCVALHFLWSDLAEVKSLAVAEAAQGRGVGSHLVSACIDEARAVDLELIFALTYRPA